MKKLFADTYYYLALRNPRDADHARAVAVTGQIAQDFIVTTSWVLLEVADALAAPRNRQGFSDLVRLLQRSQMVEIVPADEGLFQRGIDLYSRRPDKEWSLTDCISFVVMQERGITEALTGDHHFVQAGFSILLA